MSKVSIVGKTKLLGTVKIQGAKNSAMKHVILPLISPMTLKLENIPRIGSIDNLLKLVGMFGVDYEWKGSNTLVLSSNDTSGDEITIPAETFFYTSGGIITIPIIVSRFGICRIAKSSSKNETGGDQIGRNMSNVIKTLKQFGIDHVEEDEYHTFSLSNSDPFKFEVTGQSFGASMNAVLAALFKEGVSTIKKPSQEPEFLDILELLKKLGANISNRNESILIKGNQILSGTDYTNILDKNDLATWFAVSVATRSQLSFISDTSFEKINLEPLYQLYKTWNISIKPDGNTVQFDISDMDLKPLDVRAGIYPSFHTDWQQVLAPVLATIPGASSIIDEFFPVRIKHMDELGKLGLKYSISQLEEANPWGTNLNKVTIEGGKDLHANTIAATDVRGGASAVIGALIAEGESTILRTEEIDRGYEDFFERLRNLGAKIRVE